MADALAPCPIGLPSPLVVEYAVVTASIGGLGVCMHPPLRRECGEQP